MFLSLSDVRKNISSKKEPNEVIFCQSRLPGEAKGEGHYLPRLILAPERKPCPSPPPFPLALAHTPAHTLSSASNPGPVPVQPFPLPRLLPLFIILTLTLILTLNSTSSLPLRLSLPQPCLEPLPLLLPTTVLLQWRGMADDPPGIRAIKIVRRFCTTLNRRGLAARQKPRGHSRIETRREYTAGKGERERRREVHNYPFLINLYAIKKKKSK